MLDDCSSSTNEIRLADDYTESSKIVRMLLDLAYGEMFADFDDLNTLLVVDLIRLAQKYECGMLLHILPLLTAQSTLTPGNINSLPEVASFKRFFYACALNDLLTAHRNLPEAAKTQRRAPIPGEKRCHYAPPNGGPGSNVLGGGALDPMSMSSVFIDALPRNCFLSLLRASRLRYTTPAGTRQAVADEWMKQMELCSE